MSLSSKKAPMISLEIFKTAKAMLYPFEKRFIRNLFSNELIIFGSSAEGILRINE